MSDPIYVEVTTPTPIKVTVTEAVVVLPGGGGAPVDSVDGRTGVVTLTDLYAAIIHSHVVSDVTGLQAALDAKITAFADPGADRLVFWDFSAGAFAALSVGNGLTIVGTNMVATIASETVEGISERATSAEVQAMTDTAKHVTPAGLAAAAVSAATVNRIVRRDAFGRAQFVDPSAPQDASTKAYTDAGLAEKAPLESPAFTGTPTGITKTHVGLANVDNTSDAGKPVSTAQQTALDQKANINSPTFTGNPTAPTAPVSDDDTTLATTAFVHAAVAAGGGGFLTPNPFPGEVLFNAVRRGASNNSTGMTVGTLYCVPFYNTGAPLDIDRLSMNNSVAGAGGAIIRVGAYSVGVDGRIGSLLFDAGTLDATLTGDLLITVAETIPTGVVLLVAVTNDAAIRPRRIGSTPTVNDLWWRGKTGPVTNADHSLTYTGYDAGSALPSTGTTAGETFIASDCLMIAVRAA